MYKKVVYMVKSDFHYYPPCVSQVRWLKAAGAEVEVWFGSSNSSALSILEKEKIPYVCLGEEKKETGAAGKLRNWTGFRRRVAKRLKSMDDWEKQETLFWLGTAETAIPLMGLLDSCSYVLTVLELMDEVRGKRNMLGILARKAKALVVCEETRAYLMQYWYKLEKLPYVMPNKPYALGVEKYALPTCPQTEKAIEQIKGKPFIIFQGIYPNTVYMTELTKALKNLDSPYYLVMMGFDTFKRNTVQILKENYDKVIDLGSIPAPLHLEVTSHADIGIVLYKPNTLNRVFCAPNKIYEYAGFGIPSLGNNLPGLKNTVGRSGAGECVDFKADQLEAAIRRIQENYICYSENARKFYEETDNYKTMKMIITNLNIKSEG